MRLALIVAFLVSLGLVAVADIVDVDGAHCGCCAASCSMTTSPTRRSR